MKIQYSRHIGPYKCIRRLLSGLSSHPQAQKAEIYQMTPVTVKQIKPPSREGSSDKGQITV